MLNRNRVAVIMMLATLYGLALPAHADREFDERRIQREQPRPPQGGGRVEPPARTQPPPAATPPPVKSAPVRVDTREPRPAPDKSRQVAPGRPIGPVPAPAPAPIKDWRQEAKIPKEPPKPGWVLDTKYKHNHYYPPRGQVVPVLPPGHRTVVYRNQHYYCHDGVWYRRHNSYFIVVLPPFGLLVPVLPPFYTTIWVGTNTYYYAGGVYYSWWPVYQQYVVVEPPPENQVRTAPNGGSDQLYIYPAAGQSEEQQARDRYECHRWAQSETGFDPTAPGGGVPEAQHASKRADYHRALKACLEARHYSVQ